MGRTNPKSMGRTKPKPMGRTKPKPMGKTKPTATATATSMGKTQSTQSTCFLFALGYLGLFSSRASTGLPSSRTRLRSRILVFATGEEPQTRLLQRYPHSGIDCLVTCGTCSRNFFLLCIFRPRALRFLFSQNFKYCNCTFSENICCRICYMSHNHQKFLDPKRKRQTEI